VLKRPKIDSAGRGDVRYRANAGEQRSVEPVVSVRRHIGNCDVQRQDIERLEPHIHAKQIDKASCDEAAAHQQYDSQRYLRDEKGPSQSVRPHDSRAMLAHVRQVPAGYLQSGGCADEDRGDQAHHSGKGECPRIEAHGVKPRYVWGRNRDKHVQRPVRENEADGGRET